MIAKKFKHEENIQNSQLQTWLSKGEYEQVEYDWNEQLELRSELKDTSSDLKRYEEKLKQDAFYYNLAEVYSSKGKYATAKKFYDKRKILCEDALKILETILHYASRLTREQSVKLAVVDGAVYNIRRDAAPASRKAVSKLDKFLNTDD